MSLLRYEEYKPSGVDWLGDVPKHWRVARLKDIASVVNGYPFDAKYFDDEGQYPLVRIRDLDSTQTATSYRGEYVKSAEVVPGETLIGMDGDFNVGRWLGNRPALLNQRMCCVRATDPVMSKFLRYSLPAPLKEINDVTYATTVKHLSSLDVGRIRFAVPDGVELERITSFLDRETAKIDVHVEEQKRLIELLKEKRQAVISHAVTKGLDSNVPMKDSGVEWMGQVPAHWAMVSLARISLERCDGPFGSGIKSEHYTEEGALVVRLQNIRAGAFNMGQPVYLDNAYFLAELQGHCVLKGDLLVAGLGDENNLLGRACVAPEGLGLALVKADCFRFRLDSARATPQVVAWQLSSGAAWDAGILATGTTRSRIPLNVMSSRKIALPPLSEQRRIEAFLNGQIHAVDALVLSANRAVDLLSERRSALISAAVTGKIDVRNVA